MVKIKLHNLLARQIRRHLNIDPDSLTEQWDSFIHAVNAAYISSDEDRKMLERTMELSSKELLQANSEMGEIYKAFPDQFYRLDKAGVILSYKVGTSSDTFIETESLVGKKMQQIPIANVREKFEKAIQNIQSGEEQVSIEYSLPINNKIQHYEARFVPLLEEDIFVIVRNITSRKQARETLLKAKDDAEAANLAKSQFLANMSHELRTPLNAIIGYSEIIQDEVLELSTEELRADLDRIISAGKHLLKLINDVLDLSKIEAKKMDLYFSTYEIFPYIKDIATTIAPLIKTNSNTLNIICLQNIGHIYSDPLRLQQVLYNLLSNACKFTKQGTITVEVRRSPGDWIDFEISDTGIGIPLDKQGKLFEAFSQIDDSTTRSHDGTGLGLSISMHFIKMMGGTILVESVHGKGSKFTVRLPAAIAEKREQTTY